MALSAFYVIYTVINLRCHHLLSSSPDLGNDLRLRDWHRHHLPLQFLLDLELPQRRHLGATFVRYCAIYSLAYLLPLTIFLVFYHWLDWMHEFVQVIAIAALFIFICSRLWVIQSELR